MTKKEIISKANIESIKQSKIFKNGLYISAAHFMTILFGVLSATIVARYLGVELYGKLGYYTAICSLLVMFLDLGTEIYSVVQISKNEYNRNKYISMNIISRLTMTLIASAVFIGLGFSGKIDMNIAIIMLWASFLMSSMLKIPKICYQSSEDMGYMAFYDVLDCILLLVATAVFVFLGPKGIRLELVALAYLISRTVTFSMSAMTARKKYDIRLVRVEANEILQLIKLSSPLFISSVVTLLAMQIDVMMINMYMGDVQTGYYSAAKKILSNLLVFPAIMTTVLLPRLSNKSINEHKSSYILRLNFAVGLLVAAGIFIFAKIGIIILFGKEYVPSYYILQIFGIAMPMQFVNYYLGTYLVANEMQSKVLFLNIASTSVNIAINIMLIPVYQAKGAAIATLISIFIGFLFSMYYYSKTNRRNKLKELEDNSIL